MIEGSIDRERDQFVMGSEIMNIERIGVGPRMSQAVKAGSLVFLAGQVADVKGSVTEQTESILSKIDALLSKAGSDKTRIISVNIWLSDIATFPQMNAVWDKWVPAGHTPARATVEARLASAEYKVEIAVVAAV
jgi:enamine deaminase RidA (YjgF/YER057c/UK114 family)